MLHLNCHSVYSYKQSIAYVEQIAKRSQEMGETAFCITDQNSLTECIKGAMVAKKAGMKFIQGLDAMMHPGDEISSYAVLERKRALNNEMNLKRTTDEDKIRIQRELQELETVDPVPFHVVTLLARNMSGLKNLFEIYNSQSFMFDDEYLSLKQDIFDHANGLVCLAGGYDSDLQYMMSHGNQKGAKLALEGYLEAFGDNLFGKVEIDTSLEMVELFLSLGIPLVAVNDCRYVNKIDKMDYRLFCNIFAAKAIESFRENCHMMDESEFYGLVQDDRIVPYLDQALENIKIVEGICDSFDFPHAKPLINCEEELRRLCDEGWEHLRKGTEREQESLERYEYELEVINSKGFSQYFIKVLNIINVARELGILCGPGRGSGAGSEICNLLGITKIDPLEYGLYFERFLNPGRPGYPDIDLDFSSIANP